MIKINSNKPVLFLLLVMSLLILSSCGKAECKASSDCSSGPCTISRCEDKKCVYTQQPNCCGNRLNESIENGRAGNRCTCPQDYGKCEGKVKVKAGSRVEDAAYAHFYCNDFSECVIGVEKSQVSPQNVFDTINNGFLKASSVLKYNKPFSLDSDGFEFKITLDDMTKDALAPVHISNIRVFFQSDYSNSELLIAEKEPASSINSIGESANVFVPLNLGYKPQEFEEPGSIRYTIDYSYTKQISSGRSPAGETLYKEEIARDKFSAPSKRILLVQSG